MSAEWLLGYWLGYESGRQQAGGSSCRGRHCHFGVRSNVSRRFEYNNFLYKQALSGRNHERHCRSQSQGPEGRHVDQRKSELTGLGRH